MGFNCRTTNFLLHCNLYRNVLEINYTVVPQNSNLHYILKKCPTKIIKTCLRILFKNKN